MSWWRKLLSRSKQESLEGQLIKLSPKDGDIIIFRVDGYLSVDRAAQLRRKLEELVDNPEVKITLMHKDVDVTVNGDAP